MDTKTINKLEDILQTEEKNRKNDKTLEEYEKASKVFEDLVNKGLLKKRGNNLMPVDKAHLHRHKFNTAE